jgi:hypothetical protein
MASCAPKSLSSASSVDHRLRSTTPHDPGPKQDERRPAVSAKVRQLLTSSPLSSKSNPNAGLRSYAPLTSRPNRERFLHQHQRRFGFEHMPEYQVKNVEPVVVGTDIQVRVFTLAGSDVISLALSQREHRPLFCAAGSAHHRDTQSRPSPPARCGRKA